MSQKELDPITEFVETIEPDPFTFWESVSLYSILIGLALLTSFIVVVVLKIALAYLGTILP